jgi:Zn-dependent peptidase ImmA (M78 family)
MNRNLDQYALDRNIEIIKCEMPIAKLKGLYCDNVIYISDRIDTERELNCIVAEELGHYETSYGQILDQRCQKNKKQELRARRWAHEHLLRVEDIVAAYKASCRSLYEVADYLDVTEEFLLEAAESFGRRHGICKVIGNYAVYFEPLGVMEIF